MLLKNNKIKEKLEINYFHINVNIVINCFINGLMLELT